jgi:hypothetical protein
MYYMSNRSACQRNCDSIMSIIASLQDNNFMHGQVMIHASQLDLEK